MALESRTKCTGICHKLSSENGFFPSKVSNSSSLNAAFKLLVETSDGEPLVAEAADDRPLLVSELEECLFGAIALEAPLVAFICDEDWLDDDSDDFVTCGVNSEDCCCCCGAQNTTLMARVEMIRMFSLKSDWRLMMMLEDDFILILKSLKSLVCYRSLKFLIIL